MKNKINGTSVKESWMEIILRPRIIKQALQIQNTTVVLAY